MTEKRFTIIQNGDLFTVRDTVENKPMGVFEFKENEFPVFFCFHNIIDLLNELNNENKQLKYDIFNLTKTVECLEKTVKEQCNKIAWADECGVRWNEEYHEWMGDAK